MIRPRRVKGWEGRLAAAFEAAGERDFAYGRFDCLLFVAECVEATTGVDLAAELRGSYEGREGALEVLRGLARLPQADMDRALEGTVTRFLGQPVAPGFARRGDVVTVDSGGHGLAAAVVAFDGVTAWLVSDGRGLRRAPVRLWRAAWRVG